MRIENLLMIMPVIPVLKDDEVDASVLSRVISENSLKSICGLTSENAFSTRGALTLSLMDDHAEEISPRTGLSADDLRASGFKSRGRNLVEHSRYGIVPRMLVERTHARFCTSCLRDDFYFRTKWSFRSVLACDHHHERLVEVCPSCHQSIPLMRPNFRYCKCGHELTQSVTKTAELSERISARFLASSDAMGSERQCGLALPEKILQLSNKDRISTLEHLASHLVLSKHGITSSVFTQPYFDRSEHLRRTFSLFIDFPTRLYDAMEDHFDANLTNVHQRREVFGRFYLSIADKRLALFALKETLDEFIRLRAPEFAQTKRGRSWTSSKADVGRLTLADAVEYTGWSKAKIKHLIEMGELQDYPLQYGTVAIHQISVACLDRVMARSAKASKTEQRKALSQSLGLSVPVIMDLMKAGLLNGDIPVQANVQGLENRLRKRAAKVGEHSLTLRQAVYGYFRRSGMHVPEVIWALIKSKSLIRNVRRSGLPLADRIELNHEAVIQFISKFEKERSVGKTQHDVTEPRDIQNAIIKQQKHCCDSC